MRPMEPMDWNAICWIMADWPYTKDGGHITPEKIDGYMRRWFQQFHPYVWELDGEVVAFMNYRMNGIFLEITHAGVLPAVRGTGWFTRMAKDMAAKLTAEGHDVAYFSVLEKAEFILNKFNRAGEGDGQSGKIFYGTTDGKF